ncbi:MAG: 6-pyruvoyl-tetrahydropterin synthase-related protein, partial [bacterium]
MKMFSENARSWSVLPIIGLLMACGSFIYHQSIIHWLDWHLHLYWLQSFYQTFMEGHLYPRWVDGANGGMGAPVFVFYAPASFYLGSLFQWLGLNVVQSLQAVYLFSYLLLVSGAYFGLRPFTSRRNAAIGASVLLLLPQSLVYSYRFNMPASVLAEALTVWFFAFLLRLFKHKDPNKSAQQSQQLLTVVLLAMSFALLELSHTLSAFMAGCVAGLVLVYFLLKRQVNHAFVLLTGLLLGIGLASIHFIPMVLHRTDIHSDHLSQGGWLWFKNFLFVVDRPLDATFNQDAMLLNNINLALAIALVSSVVSCWYTLNKSYRYFAGLCLLILLLMSPLSYPVYALIKPLQMLQFPWRWQFIFALISLALISLLWQKNSLKQTVKAIILGSTVYLFYASFTLMSWTGTPPYTWVTADDAQWALSASRWDTLEHRPQSMGDTWKLDLGNNTLPNAWTNPENSILKTTWESEHKSFQLDARQAGELHTKVLYFPGWTARVDHKVVKINPA